jgi:two-component system, NarL family, response regulator NreC
MTFKVLIVDDSSIIRRSLRFCIEQNHDWRVCGEADNGRIAIEKVQELQPDAVILDFAMPVMNGLEAARHIARIAPEVAMVLFTLHDSGELRKEAYAAGIKDVVSKSEGAGPHLIASLKSACGQH